MPVRRQPVPSASLPRRRQTASGTCFEFHLSPRQTEPCPNRPTSATPKGKRHASSLFIVAHGKDFFEGYISLALAILPGIIAFGSISVALCFRLFAMLLCKSYRCWSSPSEQCIIAIYKLLNCCGYTFSSVSSGNKVAYSDFIIQYLKIAINILFVSFVVKYVPINIFL